MDPRSQCLNSFYLGLERFGCPSHRSAKGNQTTFVYPVLKQCKGISGPLCYCPEAWEHSRTNTIQLDPVPTGQRLPTIKTPEGRMQVNSEDYLV